jgi:type IV secretory pathway VirB4 component
MDTLKIEELLTEFDDHRVALKLMVKDIEAIKEHVDRLIPTNLDARYIRFFEEKVKAITSLFSTLLEMRKEIARSVREEIEIRRKVEKGESEYDIDTLFNIRDFADKIDDFKKEQEKIREKIPKKELEEYTDIKIPGITERIIE